MENKGGELREVTEAMIEQDRDYTDCEPFLRTASGKKFYFLSPTPEMIDVEDMITGMVNEPRFGGQFKGPHHYSVLEHCINVALLLKKWGEDKSVILRGLVHDGSEGYIKDVQRPLKKQLVDYQIIEDGVQWAIYSKFGVLDVPHDMVKRADEIMYYAEERDIRGADYYSEVPYVQTFYKKNAKNFYRGMLEELINGR
jgi:uncharacterized protein